ncbi:trigger factor [Oceanicoccus sp. KOV_DT_Chl]|uniref:trigger factor n=1 Tax=Oceanicoccus sp. KOV_DT_Chl TaxID=1904639 RepID=UPI000C7AC50B|nr:trigger factor [Oceanicoccus sp. KOV_DT_Chl]
MQVSIQTTSGLERKLTVGIPADRVDNEVNNRLQKASSTVRLDGFRPGKVPMKVMKQRFGAGVRQEVLQEVMNQSFSEAVVQENLKPAGMPNIEPKNLEEGRDLEYVATFEVFPELDLKDYSAITIEKPVAAITDADIDKMIATLREQQSTLDAVERAAKSGDTVDINFAGTKDGEAFDGGTAEGSSLVLGSGSMIPGFEDGIVGMSAGEEKTLSLSFPEDYHAEELKGAAVEFVVTVNSVSEKKLPELDDAFFEKFGVKEGGEEQFRKDVTQNMQRELDNGIKSKTKNQVMEGLVDIHSDLQLPQALVKQEISGLKGQMVQQFGGAAASLDVDSLLPDDMFIEQAERRVRLGLILNEYISKESISADPEKVKETIEGFASTYEDPEEVVNYYYSNQQQLQEIQAMVLEDSVVEKLLSIAKVTEKKCSYDEVMAPEASAEEA